MRALTAVAVSAVLLCWTPHGARAYNNGMAKTPPMGWNSWCTDSLCNAFGADPCSEHQVKSTVDAMVAQGMVELGYNFVALDDCWSAQTRNATGHLQAEPKQFPSGMAALADYVHSKNMFLGLYTCAGTKTCKGDRPGSFGHYDLDAQTLAGWGIDLVKMDHCGVPSGVSDQEMYGNMSRALNETGRPMVFSLCQWGEDDVEAWGPGMSQMYRIAADHLPLWSCPGKVCGGAGAGFGQGTREIIEFVGSLKPSQYAQQYAWLDPDFLMTLYFPTMDFEESRTEYTFWALWSAPLLVSTDVRNLSADKKAILLNKEVIAVNQDTSYTAGDRVSNATDGGQVWARTLADGDKAVVLYNNGAVPKSELNITVSWADLGWDAHATVKVRDMWQSKDVGTFSGSFSAASNEGAGPVKPRDVQFLRCSLVTPEPLRRPVNNGVAAHL